MKSETEILIEEMGNIALDFYQEGYTLTGKEVEAFTARFKHQQACLITILNAKDIKDVKRLAKKALNPTAKDLEV